MPSPRCAVGALDVYLTDSDTALEDASPVVANIAAATLSYCNRLERGTRRLRVTGRGDPRDLRLDLPTFELADQARVTLVLQPSVGGVLVHALASQHQGALTALRNPHARVRLAAGVARGGKVTASVSGVSLSVSLTSPSLGAYTLMPAGRAAPEVAVGGHAVDTSLRDFDGGSDFTLAVMGDPDGADNPVHARLAPDRNLLPSSAYRARLRLLHMAPELEGRAQVSLTKDLVVVTSDPFFANPNLYAPADAGDTAARLVASSPDFSDGPFFDEDVVIVGRGVYTLFVMTGAERPVGLLSRER